MEVILLKDSEIGDRGSVVKVTRGYARNFLIPRGFALENTDGNQTYVADINNQRKKKFAKEKEQTEILAKKINGEKPLLLKVKGGESGSMFGAITNIQLAEALKEATGIEIDRRRIGVRSIKDASVTEFPVRLPFGITATAKIKIELEVEKKAGEEAPKKRKPRKKEEILSELEAKEQAEAAAKAEAEAKA